VNDGVDGLPAPNAWDTGTSTSGQASITDVGVGSAPAGCESGRVFGRQAPSDWWFQAHAMDGKLWTICVHGMGSVPAIAQGDVVLLDVDYKAGVFFGFGPAQGNLEVRDAAGTSMLAGVSDSRARGTRTIDLVRGAPVCAFAQSTSSTCLAGGTRNEVVATTNGETITLPPFAVGDVGGYRLAIGQDFAAVAPPRCTDYFGEQFVAAAVKLH
jgi:hypothetical protein